MADRRPESASRTAPEQDRVAGGQLFWTRKISLTARILAVNLIAMALLAGSLFLLDSFRKQLLDERFKLARAEARIAADALDEMADSQRRALMARMGADQKLRIRLYDAQGRPELDSFTLGRPSFVLADPAQQTLFQRVARALDRGVDALVGSPPVEKLREPATDRSDAWPEIAQARQQPGGIAIGYRYAPDRTPVITAAATVGNDGETLLTMRNATDVTQSIRDARQTLAILSGAALLLSIQLSLFLARTIVQPLRVLVRAAVRVRLGRDRAVIVPRLPERGDEIGLLARAISDMTAALRQRIDAVESFAADVAHELKNPLASLRSAIEAMDRVEQPELRRQLQDIAAQDVRRIDRLITEIADASRIDAELSRATFEPVDLAALAERLIGARALRDQAERALGAVPSPSIRFRRGPGPALVQGDAARLERVLENLLDNAVSFSPPGGTVEVMVANDGAGAGGNPRVSLSVSDDGPGVPDSEREKVFDRFHSVRPDGEAFGSHSGLGLAIARTIAQAHDGTLVITERADGREGACLVLALPAA
jgi:two-component system sensor histidine kinase ChvG